MSLPVADLAAIGETMAGTDLTPPRNPILATPATGAMARLQRLHAAADTLAEEAPEIIAHPEAARGLEQALIEALLGCLCNLEERPSHLAQGQHAVVLRRFRRLIEQHPEPLYISDICQAIRVSERTLRLCCGEHLGMSPKRYLTLRRLNLARQALRTAPAGRTTVTEIAMRHGFWQLGRFAVVYRSVFGEMPIATLRRQPG